MDFLDRLEKKESAEFRRHSIAQYAAQLDALKFPIIIGAIFLLGGILYVALGKNIYFWDDATYWEISRSLVNGEISGSFWQTVYNSIGTLDYNYLAALPSAGWMLIFGQSRLAYVAGLTVMYIFPSLYLMYRLAVKLSNRPMLAEAAAVFMLPVLMFETFSGFADVGGMIMMLGCYNLYFTKDDITSGTLRYIAIGALLVLMMIFRRYFAFFAVSFITVSIIECIVKGRRAGNIAAMLITAALLLCTVFYPFLRGILLRDYGELYSSYKYSVGTDMRLITRYFGLIFIVLALAVPIAAIKTEKEYRPLLLWSQILVCAAMFMATQTHGQQHLLLYIPAFMIMAMFMVNYIPRKAAVPVICAVIVINMGSTFINREQPSNIRDIKGYAAVPTFSMRPVRRDDIQSVLALRQGLDYAVPDDGSKCGVISSSFIINDSILRNVYASVGEDEERGGSYIVSMPEVDSRDMDRLDEFYTADYVLVGIPAQTHLAQGEQTIVEAAADSFANNTDIAELYREVDGFVYYVDDVEFKLYKRSLDIDSIRKREFESKINESL